MLTHINGRPQVLYLLRIINCNREDTDFRFIHYVGYYMSMMW